MDQQLLSNDEIFNDLKYIARPQCKLDMDKWLGQSVWYPDSYELFKRKEYISSHMDDYVQAWALYEVFLPNRLFLQVLRSEYQL